MEKYLTLLPVGIGLLLIFGFSAIYEHYDILSSDEKQYMQAMQGSTIERHIGFWLPASIFYTTLGTIGVRIYNTILYILGVSILIYYSRHITNPFTRLLVVSSFGLSPFVVYYIPRILSEASSYTLTILSLALISINQYKSIFLSGFLWSLGFISKYYLIITLPFALLLLYYYNKNKILYFTSGVTLPVFFMLLYSYLTTGDVLYVVIRAGPEVRVPLNERQFILQSLLLSSISIVFISLPFTKELFLSLIRAYRNCNGGKIIALGFVLMAIANFILGFLHMTGMENIWRYKDHIRLATVAIPTFSFIIMAFPPKSKVTKRYITALIVLSIITSILLLILRLKTYNIV